MSAVVNTCVRFCVGPTIREAPFAGLESSPRQVLSIAIALDHERMPGQNDRSSVYLIGPFA